MALLRWWCILKGRVTPEQLSTMHHQLSRPTVVRVQASVRFGAVSEVCFLGSNPNPNPNPNPRFVGDPNASLTGGKAIAVPGEPQGDAGRCREM